MTLVDIVENESSHSNYSKELNEINVPNNHLIAVHIFTPIVDKTDIIHGSIFLFHGVGGCSNIWRHQVEYFVQKQWKIISVDLLGHGKSRKSLNSADYEFQQLVIDAIYIFDKFVDGIQNVIIGHSYGCSIATYLASERKKYVNRLVLISGGSPAALGNPPFLFTMCDCFLCCFHHVIIFEFRKRAFYQKQLSSSNLTKDKKIAVNIDSRTLKAIMLGQNWEEGGESYHKKLMVPTLLIYGKHDKFVSSDDEYEMLAVLPVATFRAIENAGHMVMLEEPNQVNRLIEEHLIHDWSTFATLPNEHNNANRRKSEFPRHIRKTLPCSLQSKFTINTDSKWKIIKNKIYPINIQV